VAVGCFIGFGSRCALRSVQQSTVQYPASYCIVRHSPSHQFGYRCIKMIRQLTPFLFAFVAIAVHAEPFRRRRQSADDATAASASSTPATLPLAISVPCPVQCNLRLVQAWAKAVSFDFPSTSMVNDGAVLGRSSNRTLDLMCSLFASHGRCLRACDASNDVYKAAIDSTPSYSQVCTDKQSDIDSSSPCLSKNAALFQRVCLGENEELLAASTRLAVQTQLERRVLRDYCRSANLQSFCTLPLVRQTCGDAPYNAIRSIINASLVGVRVSVGEKAITDFYPECDSYLNAISHGIPVIFSNGTLINLTAGNHTAISYTTTDPMDFDNSTPVENTTSLMMRDDASGPTDDPEGGRFGNSASPRFQTTTSSDAARSNCKNTMALFTTFSVLLCIFL